MLLTQITTRDARRAMLSQHRKTLAERDIFINPDLSPEERKIAYNLRKCARNYRSEGKNASCLGQKLVVDNIFYTWSLSDDKLIPLPPQSSQESPAPTQEMSLVNVSGESQSKNEMATANTTSG